MPRKIIPPSAINEGYLRELVGGLVTHTAPSNPVSSPPEQLPTATFVPLSNVAEHTQPPEPSESPTSSGGKRRKIPLSDYETAFLQPRTIRHRMTICVSEQTKQILSVLVKQIGPPNLSVSSFAENVLRHHLELFRDEINQLNKLKQKSNIL